MVSHPEAGSDSPIGSDRDRGRDTISANGELTGFFASKRGGSLRRSFIFLYVSYCYGSLLVIPFQGGSPS